MLPSELDERSRAILWETVSNYILTAEPVGSRTLSRKLTERLSPATVRNVMADLEDLGFLAQPHTSAGRIPTDKGYRFFVDEIIRTRRIDSHPEFLDEDLLAHCQDHNLAGFLETACSVLSRNSHQAGLVMVPSFSNLPLKHIDFIRVGKSQVLAVFISEMGVVQNKVIQFEDDLTQDRLTSIAHYLQDEFKGHSLNSIRKELSKRIQTEREHYNRLMKETCDLWSHVFPDEKENFHLLVEGLINLLDQPDFATNLERMKALMKTVEEKDKLVQLLDLCMRKDGLAVIIGEENGVEEMQNCSLIARNYRIDNEKVGTLAIVGPKRMDYFKMIGLVNTTADNVSELLTRRKERGE